MPVVNSLKRLGTEAQPCKFCGTFTPYAVCPPCHQKDLAEHNVPSWDVEGEDQRFEEDRRFRERLSARQQKPGDGFSISGAAVQLGVTTRSVWGALKATGISPRQDHHQGVLMPSELERLEEHQNSLRARRLTFTDGTVKVLPSEAAKETGYSEKWVRELVKSREVSGFIGSQVVSLVELGLITSRFVPKRMLVDLQALMDYQAGQQSRLPTTPTPTISSGLITSSACLLGDG